MPKSHWEQKAVECRICHQMITKHNLKRHLKERALFPAKAALQRSQLYLLNLQSP